MGKAEKKTTLHMEVEENTSPTESQMKAVAFLTLAAEKARVIAFKAGDPMPDGSIFAGLTADGSKQIYAMPTDLDAIMIFNDAAKRVEKLNAEKSLGHDDWQIPSLEHLRVLYRNQYQGALKGTFNTSANKGSGSGYLHWYWSSTESRVYPTYVRDVRFSDANEDWLHKDLYRLSCRPVRLVAASSVPVPAPAPAPGR